MALFNFFSFKSSVSRRGLLHLASGLCLRYPSTAALFLGFLLSFGLAPYFIYPLPFICFSGLLLILQSFLFKGGVALTIRDHFKSHLVTKSREISLFLFKVGYSFGFGYFLGGLWWIGYTTLIYVKLPFVLGLLGLFVLPLVLSFFWGLALPLVGLMSRDSWTLFWSFTLVIGLSELARTYFFTGFPWNAVGQLAVPNTLFMQLIPVTGILGLNFFAVALFSLPFLFFNKKTRGKSLFLWSFLLAFQLFYGTLQLWNANPKGVALVKGSDVVRLVQPSLTAKQRDFPEAGAESLAILAKLTNQASGATTQPPAIIIWPETALPYWFAESSPLAAQLASYLTSSQHLVSGLLRLAKTDTGGSIFFNSLVTIDSRGRIVSYVDKQHLVPFGEYVPFNQYLKHLGVRHFVHLPQGFSFGRGSQLLTVAPRVTWLSLICYEIIFPLDSQRLSDRISAIINVSNDSWYGNTAGPYQHFQQARLQAVHTGLPVLRVANSGISGVIDGYGRVLDFLPYGSRGIIDAVLPGRLETVWHQISALKKLLTLLIILILCYFESYRHSLW